MPKTDYPEAEKEETQKILVRSLCKTYRNGTQHVVACNEIDFTAHAGDITTLLGPNGAGKSSLLKCMAGLLLPSSGTICVCGERDPSRIRSVVGYVGEHPALDQELTVAENLFFEEKFRSHSGTQATETRMERIRQAVALTGIGSVLGKKCADLSKGYAQRVSLAMALCFDPEVLILDEFSGGLDPAQIVAIRTALKKLAERKLVIVSTHSIGEALELGGRIVIMKSGSIVSSGKPAEILEKTGKKTLEEAFLQLTS